MKNITGKLATHAPPIILLILTMILATSALSMATGPDLSNVGQAQKIQDPQKLQRALHTLFQKAHAQNKIINAWHRKALLKTAQMKAKSRKLSRKTIAEDASRRNSGNVTAMVKSD
jgi:hypothetical protein